jgi:hypothetical protein
MMMKYLTIACLAIAALVVVSVGGEAPAGKHLFILSGQSNMVGLKPDISFTPAVQEVFGTENAIVVKDAQSGQPIRRWRKGWKPAQGDPPPTTGDLYDRLIGKVQLAIEGQTLASVTFVWMQGERDAREKHGEVYGDAFKGILTQLKADLQLEEINFVIGRLSDFDMDNKRYPHWTMVRDVQVQVTEEDPKGAWVDTDDLNNKTGKDGAIKHDLHYTRDGYKVLGQRFANEAIKLIRKGQ